MITKQITNEIIDTTIKLFEYKMPRLREIYANYYYGPYHVKSKKEINKICGPYSKQSLIKMIVSKMWPEININNNE